MRRFIKIVATLFGLAGLLILGCAWYLGLLTPGSGNIVLPGQPGVQTGESTNYEDKEGKSNPGRPTDKLENDYANRSESAVDPKNATVGDAVDPENATVEDIEKKYRPKFAALQQEYNAKINSLAAAGINEYMSYKNNNQKPPVAQLIKKYLNAGRALESECDSKFNSLLAQMKNELINANLPLDLVDKAKSEYRSQKIQRQKTLIRNGLKFVSS